MYVNLTKVRVILEEGTSAEKKNALAKLACGGSSQLKIDVGEHSSRGWGQPWTGDLEYCKTAGLASHEEQPRQQHPPWLLPVVFTPDFLG